MVVSRRGAPSGAPRGVSSAPQRVLLGDCVAEMAKLPAASVDLVFADPPYNLQLANDLKRPDDSRVDAVTDDWDKFASFSAYDEFTRLWLTACRRVMKPAATIWVIGSYHNIFRVGAIMQDLGFWILNDVIWRKSNPMPNFRGRRFTNAHETLIWAAREPSAKGYTFNYETLKAGNEDIQVRSDWTLALCTGEERLKGGDGKKLHPTQKPEALLARVLLSSSRLDDLVLDPFCGTGTTGAVAKRLVAPLRRHRARRRLRQSGRAAHRRDQDRWRRRRSRPSSPRARRRACRLPRCIERGLVTPGAILTDARQRHKALVRADGAVSLGNSVGSIHRIGALAQGLEACNGWTFWHVETPKGLRLIDELRAQVSLGNGGSGGVGSRGRRGDAQLHAGRFLQPAYHRKKIVGAGIAVRPEHAHQTRSPACRFDARGDHKRHRRIDVIAAARPCRCPCRRKASAPPPR